MKTRTRALAKVGIFGSIDNPQIVTEKDLLEIVETFPDIIKSPVSLNGHWLDASSPRLGNVIAVTFDDATKTLFGTIEEDDVLYEAVESGYYPDVSIGAKQRAQDGKMYLHHLAYLGEEPPAIKDLQKEIKETLGIAASDAKECKQFPATNAKQLTLSDESKKINKELHGMLDEKEIEAMRLENERLKKEAEERKLQLSDALKNAQLAAKEKLAAAMNGKLPKEKHALVFALADSFEAGKIIELSDSNGAKTKESASDVLCKIFDALQKPVAPGALNLSDSADDGKMPEKMSFSRI